MTLGERKREIYIEKKNPERHGKKYRASERERERERERESVCVCQSEATIINERRKRKDAGA